MKIPNKTLKMWVEYKEEGDIALLAAAINKSEPTVYKIFSSGKAKVEDAEKINEFYTERKRRADSLTIQETNK